MIASRVWPRAIPSSTKTPSPSGPRWASAAFILVSTALASSLGRVKPAMPHIGLPTAGGCAPPRQGAMLHHPADLVRRAPTRLEIDPRLDLGDDAEQHEKDAR